MDKNFEQIVPQQQRDQVFAQLRKINKNNMCIDCEKKNPKWSSIHLSLHLCIDCAGKHRQYGVMYSFVKSTNLDAWNQKQLMFMQKGGNARAIDYFKKCGILSETHKHIDYKSPIAQKYKQILTAEVEAQIHGKPLPKKQTQVKKKEVVNNDPFAQNEPKKQIPNAEIVKPKEEKGKKKGKKKIGTKINIDIKEMELDDGVPMQEKDKIIKAYENKQEEEKKKEQQGEETNPYVPEETKAQQQKQLSEEESKQRLQEFKHQKNVNNLSSDSFKDNSAAQASLKQNLNKFQNSQSISSSDINGEKEPQENQTLGKVKDVVSDVGGKLYNKLSSYWGKK